MPANDSPGATAPFGSLSRLARLSVKRLSPSLLRDAWLVAETEASLALAAWRSAPQSQKGKAYASYVVALEREAEAADLLAMRLAPAGA